MIYFIIQTKINYAIKNNYNFNININNNKI